MTNRKNLILLYLLIAFEIIILLNSNVVIKSVTSSSILFILYIFPSMFPGMIIGNLLIKERIWLIIPNSIKKLFNKLFGFDDVLTSIFIISMFCGTPSNALYINEYLNDGKAQKMLQITHFINPLFVVAGVGIGVFKSAKIGFILLFIMWTENFIKAFILREKNIKVNKQINIKENSFINNLIESVKMAVNASLLIFGLVICFNLLVTLICNIFYIPDNINAILNGILEMTGGIMKLKNVEIIMPLKIMLAYLFLNFGGLCIHMQTFSMIENKKISYLKYLIFRLF